MDFEKLDLIFLLFMNHIGNVLKGDSPFDSSVIIWVFDDEQFEKVIQNSNFQIDQPFYLFKASTGEMYETYTVNDMKLRRKIGHYNENSDEFFWEPGVSSNLIQRRSNDAEAIFELPEEVPEFDFDAMKHWENLTNIIKAHKLEYKKSVFWNVRYARVIHSTVRQLYN